MNTSVTEGKQTILTIKLSPQTFRSVFHFEDKITAVYTHLQPKIPATVERAMSDRVMNTLKKMWPAGWWWWGFAPRPSAHTAAGGARYCSLILATSATSSTYSSDRGGDGADQSSEAGTGSFDIVASCVERQPVSS